MATNAYFGYVDGDVVRASYIHFDGDTVGYELLRHVKDLELAKALVEEGARSYLEYPFGQDDALYDEPVEVFDIIKYKRLIFDTAISFIYVFDEDGIWKYMNCYTRGMWRPVKEIGDEQHLEKAPPLTTPLQLQTHRQDSAIRNCLSSMQGSWMD